MATIVNVQDPVSLNNLSIDINGRIGINNWPSVQTVSGTVSIATFPAVQQISGTVDVTDRALRQLGIVSISSGGVGTNTAPGYTVIQDGATAANKMAVDGAGNASVNLGKVGGTVIGNTNPVPVQDIEQTGYIALTSPPTMTNAGSDTPLTFSSQVARVIVQNNTSANVYYAFDTVASAGSLVLVPGAFLTYPKKCTVLHLYTAAAANINGTTVGNIVVLGAN